MLLSQHGSTGRGSRRLPAILLLAILLLGTVSIPGCLGSGDCGPLRATEAVAKFRFEGQSSKEDLADVLREAGWNATVNENTVSGYRDAEFEGYNRSITIKATILMRELGDGGPRITSVSFKALINVTTDKEAESALSPYVEGFISDFENVTGPLYYEEYEGGRYACESW